MRNFVLISILETRMQNKKNVKVFMINIYYKNKAKQPLLLKNVAFYLSDVEWMNDNVLSTLHI